MIVYFPKAPPAPFAPSAICARGLACSAFRTLQSSEGKVTFPQVGEPCAVT